MRSINILYHVRRVTCGGRGDFNMRYVGREKTSIKVSEERSINAKKTLPNSNSSDYPAM